MGQIVIEAGGFWLTPVKWRRPFTLGAAILEYFQFWKFLYFVIFFVVILFFFLSSKTFWGPVTSILTFLQFYQKCAKLYQTLPVILSFMKFFVAQTSRTSRTTSRWISTKNVEIVWYGLYFFVYQCSIIQSI